MGSRQLTTERIIMKFTNTVYDILKWLVIIVFPALGTFYAALAAVWNLPYAHEIVTTITALAAFLGALLGISTAAYQKDIGEATLK